MAAEVTAPGAEPAGQPTGWLHSGCERQSGLEPIVSGGEMGTAFQCTPASSGRASTQPCETTRIASGVRTTARWPITVCPSCRSCTWSASARRCHVRKWARPAAPTMRVMSSSRCACGSPDEHLSGESGQTYLYLGRGGRPRRPVGAARRRPLLHRVRPAARPARVLATARLGWCIGVAISRRPSVYLLRATAPR